MEHHHPAGTKNIGIAVWLDFTFALVEIAGGLWTNSRAILSDAVHDLGDSFSLGMAWVLERRAQQGSDSTFSYGHDRRNRIRRRVLPAGGDSGMIIQVIGVGCSQCRQMTADVQAVVAQLGLEAEVGRIEDPQTIVEMGIFSVPRLMIDGQLVPFRYRGRRSIEEVLGKVSR
jgi:hypothetical protein